MSVSPGPSIACPSMGVDLSFTLVLPEVSSFSHWVLEFFLAVKEGLRTGDVWVTD